MENEDEEFSSCRIDKQRSERHPEPRQQLRIPMRYPEKKTVEHRALCIWVIFCLNAGKGQPVRTMRVKPLLCKVKDAILQGRINGFIFRLTALELGICNATLIEVFIPI